MALDYEKDRKRRLAYKTQRDEFAEERYKYDLKWRKCKKCGVLISFELNENGKYYPIEFDGKSHFLSCYPNKPKKSSKSEKPSKPRKIKNSGPRMENGPRTVPDDGFTDFYDGAIPPWDLEGEFEGLEAESYIVI